MTKHKDARNSFGTHWTALALLMFAVISIAAASVAVAEDAADATSQSSTPDTPSVSTQPPSGVSQSATSQSATQSTPSPAADQASPSRPNVSADTDADEESDEEEVDEEPWDFSPYKVLVWIASDDPGISAETLQTPLSNYLDRDFSSMWRLTIENAPPTIRAAATRGLSSLTYDTISASDPVVAVKRDDKDIIRIRVARDLGEYVKRIPSTSGLIADTLRRGDLAGHPDLDGMKGNLVPLETDLIGISQRWTDTATQGLLLPRGLALTLDKPKAKLIELPIAELVSTAVDNYDKIYIVQITSTTPRPHVSVIELETLMRFFGMPLSVPFTNKQDLPFAVGHAITEVFSPVVRIDEAGQDSVKGLIRASGLILDSDSPGLVRLGDVLEPMVRKDDRSGKPLIVGRLDWAYLLRVADPVAHDDEFKVDGKPFIKGEVLSNDTDEDTGDPLSVVRVNVERAALGRVHEITVSEEDESVIGTVLFTDLDKGEFTFTPGDAFTGQTSFQYTVSDGYGNTDVGTVWIGGKKDSGEEDTKEPAETKASKRVVKMMYYSGRPGGLQGRQNKRTYKMALKVNPRLDATMLRLHAKGEPDFPLIGYEIYERELTSKSMTFVGRTDWDGRISIQKNDDPLRLMYVKNGGAVLARLPMIPGLTTVEVADLIGDDMRLQAEAYIRGVQNAIVDLVAIRKLIAARVKLRLQKGQMTEAEELVIAMREQPTSQTLADDMGFKLPAFLKVIDNPNQRAKVDNMFSVTREMLTKQLSPKDLRDVEEMLLRAKKNGGKLPPDDEEEPEFDNTANSGGDAP
ncbi:Ig-like domain-containing protein [Stieleria varia]|nr:Ig-like domain-containing protein [Stieleria varia]